MKRVWVVLFLIIGVVVYSAEISLPHIPTDPDQSGAISVYVKVINTETNRPSTNFPVKVVMKRGGYINYITDVFGEVNLIMNKEFRERWLAKVEYDDQGGKFKVETRVTPFESEIAKDKRKNPYAFFLYKEYWGSRLNEDEFNFTASAAYNLQYYLGCVV